MNFVTPMNPFIDGILWPLLGMFYPSGSQLCESAFIVLKHLMGDWTSGRSDVMFTG